MEIKNKRENYIVDDENNKYNDLKIAKLLLAFLQDSEKISNEDLNTIIRYFYLYKVELSDYLEYINQKENTEFDKVIEIPTNMIYFDYISEGHGKDFSWEGHYYQRYIYAATKDFLSTKDEYTEIEIKKLTKLGKIYPIYPFHKETTKKPKFYINDKIKYLVSNFSNVLNVEDEYFNFMIEKVMHKIGINNLMEDIRKFIINLKLDSVQDEDYIFDEYERESLKLSSDIADELITLYNKSSIGNQIKTTPLDIVLDYLIHLPSVEGRWYTDITLEQIINVIKELEYESNEELCRKIEEIVISLDEPELCYEMAANIDWINQEKMAEIVINSGDSESNYLFASNIDGADIEKHKEAILNSDSCDGFLLEKVNRM